MRFKKLRAVTFGGFIFLLSHFLFPPALHAETLRVATLNVQNYTLERRSVEGRREWNYPKPEKEKAALRALIRITNPDVLALQEIGGDAFVEELRRDLASDGAKYPFAATVAGPDGKRQLAIISRKPFKAVTPVSKIPTRYNETENHVARGLLSVTVATGDGDFTLHTLHLKSRLTSDKSDPESAAQRNAEATAIRNVIRDRHSGDADALFLVCGDFNDRTTSAPLRRFTTIGQNAFLTMLPASDANGETWTYRNKRDDYYSRSDYLLCSPALAKKLITAGDGKLPVARIADTPEADRASDHRMIFLDIPFSELKKNADAKK